MYYPQKDTDPLQFIQPEITKRLVESISNGNKALLEKYRTVQEHRFDISRVPARSPLSAIAPAIVENESAWPAFQALWHELVHVSDRPPILFVLEGLEHLLGLSQFHDPQFKPVHAFELALPRLFLSCLAGRALGPNEPLPKFPNGAAFIATSGGSNSPTVPAYLAFLAQAFAAAAGAPIPEPDPFNPRAHDPRLHQLLQGLDVLRLGPVSRDEARAVMDYWASSGVLRSAVTEDAVANQCAMSNGIMHELVRGALMTVKS